MECYSLAKRQLGSTGLHVTPVGLGGAYLGRTPDGESDEIGVDTVLHALEAGVNLIDTSPAYCRGESERRVGLAIDAWRQRGGSREDFVLSSKTGTRTRPHDYSYDGTMASIGKSLELLRTDYLDLALVHDPYTIEPPLAEDGAFCALERLREEGVVRAIGLGARPHEFHQRCLAAGKIQASLTFADYNLLYQSAVAGVFEPAARQRSGVMNAMVLLSGLLGGPEPRTIAAKLPARTDPERVARAQEMWRWAADHGLDLLTLNLHFCLAQPLVHATLLGAATPAQLEADLAAIAAPVPAALWESFLARFGLPQAPPQPGPVADGP